MGGILFCALLTIGVLFLNNTTTGNVKTNNVSNDRKKDDTKTVGQENVKEKNNIIITDGYNELEPSGIPGLYQKVGSTIIEDNFYMVGGDCFDKKYNRNISNGILNL